jgi:DUF1707 SHOCT-like domain
MCGYRHYEQRHHPIAHQQDRSLRVSDAERDEVATLLRDAAAEGRLTPDELDERVEKALSARTGADLDALLADLPRKRVVPAPPSGEGMRNFSLLVGVALLVTGLVLAAGVGHIWTVWILGFVVFKVARGGRTRGAHWI